MCIVYNTSSLVLTYVYKFRYTYIVSSDLQCALEGTLITSGIHRSMHLLKS